jgi:hypothetical protein
MDVVSLTLCLEEAGFIIREEVVAAIVVTASSDATETWECGTIGAEVSMLSMVGDGGIKGDSCGMENGIAV